MAESHVVSALVAKRAELAGLIDHAEKQLAQLRIDLTHIDGTLRVFAPDVKPSGIMAKRYRNRDGVFQWGGLPRAVVDVLRDAPEPMDLGELAQAVMKRHGMDLDDAKLQADVAARVSKVLAHKRKQGLCVNSPGNGRGVLWSVAE